MVHAPAIFFVQACVWLCFLQHKPLQQGRAAAINQGYISSRSDDWLGRSVGLGVGDRRQRREEVLFRHGCLDFSDFGVLSVAVPVYLRLPSEKSHILCYHKSVVHTPHSGSKKGSKKGSKVLPLTVYYKHTISLQKSLTQQNIELQVVSNCAHNIFCQYWAWTSIYPITCRSIGGVLGPNKSKFFCPFWKDQNLHTKMLVAV